MKARPVYPTPALLAHRFRGHLVLLGMCLVLMAITVAEVASAATESSAKSGASGSSAVPNGSQRIPGRYIVVFKDSVDHPGVVANAQATENNSDLGFVYRHALKGYSAELPAAALRAISNDPRVASIEPDVLGGTAAQTMPTGIKRILATANKKLALNEQDDLRVDADIAILDTGLDYKHPDLHVVARTDCSNGATKQSECTNESGTAGQHGTHVAGTAAAIDNGSGVTGVAPGARLWGVQVLDEEGFGDLSEFIAGIDWVTAHASEIEVANASLRYFTTSSPAFSAAAKAAIEAGVVFVAAAGNESEPVKYVPGNYADIVTVSALADFDGQSGGKAGGSVCREVYEFSWPGQADDSLAEFSNYGSTVDIAAPGVCILSTIPGGEYEDLGWSGTSMASPHVAGAAAILASKSNPNSKKDTETIRETLVKAGNLGWTDTSGDGIQEKLLEVSNESTFGLIPKWSIQTTPNGTGAEHSALYDIACEPATTSVCTAVGKQTSKAGTSTPYAQYWNGSAWANQSAAAPEGASASELQANHCLSKTSCVAAGSYTTKSGTFSLAESWNGTSWSIQTTPNPAGATETALRGVSCNVVTACIAVGNSNAEGKWAVAMLGNSGKWSLQTVPKPGGATSSELNGVECTSATSCVAVGRYSVSASVYWAMSATWNGTEWTLQTVPKPAEAKRSILLDVSCSDATHCTAVGGYFNASGVQVTFVARWDGKSWVHQASPNPVGSSNSVLQNVSCAESSSCVAVGDWLNTGTWQPMTQYWNGTEWSLETTPNPAGATFGLLEGVSCRVACLAVGWYTDSGGKDKTLGEARK